MKKNNIIMLLLVPFVLLWQTAYAEIRSWDLDKGHSSISFGVDHIFSKVQGHFRDFKVEVKFDPQNLKKSSFSFEIAVKSIDTYIGKRDKHLLSKDFFEAKKYPLITFKSDHINAGSGGDLDVVGKLTIKGETYPLTMVLTLAGIKEHPVVKGKDVVGFNGNLTLDRLAYKVGSGKFYDMGVVGKDVDVFVTLELLSGR